jgi:hypothetical protein
MSRVPGMCSTKRQRKRRVEIVQARARNGSCVHPGWSWYLTVPRCMFAWHRGRGWGVWCGHVHIGTHGGERTLQRSCQWEGRVEEVSGR